MISLLKRSVVISALHGIALLAFLGLVSGAELRTPAEVPSEVRATYNLNLDWKLFVGDASGAESAEFNDTTWKSVTLPHAWNEDEAFKKDIHELSTGIAWYRKHFRLSP